MTARLFSPDLRARRIAVAIFSGMALAFLGMGFWYFDEEKEGIIREKYQTLEAIGELKSKLIQHWQKNCLADAWRIAKDTAMVGATVRLLGDPANESFQADVRRRMDVEIPYEEYTALFLFAPDGGLLCATGEEGRAVSATTQEIVRRALERPEPVMSDFFRFPDGHVCVDVAVAVRDREGKPLAVLVMRSNASAGLFSFLQFWPAGSPSTETVLARKEGNEVVIVNQVRTAGGNVPVERRFPLSRTDLPAVQALSGKRGRTEGRDYRNEEVIANLVFIPGSSWFLVTKMDRKDILAEAGYHAGVIGLIVGLLVLLSAAVVAALYRYRQAGILRDLLRSENDRWESLEILHAVFDAIPVRVFWKDTESVYLGCNEAFSRDAGLKNPGDIIGKEDSDMVWRERAGTHRSDDHAVVMTGQPKLHCEEIRATADGKQIEVLMSKIPLRNAAGTIVGVLGTYVDISSRKKMEEELRENGARMRAITDCAQDAILMMDPEGRISYWNPAAERIFGYTSGEAMGRNLHNLIAPPRYHAAFATAWPLFRKTGTGNVVDKTLDIEAVRKDGTEISIQLSLSSIRIKDAWHAVGILRDITKRKAMESRLRETLAEAESAARVKSEFLAVMSHELRTPLNGVLGFADLLSSTPLVPEQKAFVRRICESGNHLLEIVNDILDFSSIEKGRMAIDTGPVVLSSLVDSSCDVIRRTATGKGLAFHCEMADDVPEQILGDARRIRQILINLLGNAVKFTSKGSIFLRVAPVAAGGRECLDFAVGDTGPGIPPETLSCLFQPFTQADSTLRRKFEGTGLGLAISLRLAEAMGGTITVNSSPGKGSTFTLRIPVRLPAEPGAGNGTPTGSTGSHAPSAGGRVLVVEDDRLSRLLAGKVLSALGQRMEGAANGFEAVRAFAPGKFSAILMDMQMPEMDGIEATKKIREIEKGTGTHVPIIALTANVMPGDRERCLSAGMDDFLSKPFQKAELSEKLGLVAAAAH